MSRTRVAGRLLGDHLPREVERAGQQVALDDRIEDPRVAQFLRRDARAADDHLQRFLDSDDTRQPLGTARPGQDAELHLR